MATRGVGTTITYKAWNTSANTPTTGDSTNHTLKWIKDGSAATPSNSPSEVDATNAKGVYSVALTTAETDCTCGTLAGVSATSNISIFGPILAFSYESTASYPANFATLTINGSGSVAVSSGTVTSISSNVAGSVVGSVTSVSSAVATVTSVSAAERNAIADAILNRDMSVGTDSGSTAVRTARQALRVLRNKVTITSSSITVYAEDDATTSWTGSVTASSGAFPITGVDPSGP